ncbi:putative membrane protein [Clostridium bornimense]|uniref:Putative membrane protein n=1 Tax=Clostridium bornimense TaxID=1216932 RepID=W6S5Y6_9CLOT|nr:DMT family transporter [Clostridium bornimense]CDM69762.1 putative membrane protein [Clostridium bornimense]
MGIILSIIAGLAMTFQGVFNTRLQEKVGSFEANAIVQGTAFILAIILLFFLGKGNIREAKDINKIYLLGGVIGVIITYTVMGSISSIGTTFAISTILIAQLLSAAIMEWFGWFGTEKIPFSLHTITGVALMIIGILVFKFMKF